MSIWKWDPFEEFLSQAPLQALENEFGINSDLSLSLKRDSEYKLELFASGPPRQSEIKQKPPLGTIYRNNSEILLKSYLGEICLHGVHHTKSKLAISHQSTTTDTFSIEKILFTAPPQAFPNILSSILGTSQTAIYGLTTMTSHPEPRNH